MEVVIHLLYGASVVNANDGDCAGWAVFFSLLLFSALLFSNEPEKDNRSGILLDSTLNFDSFYVRLN